MNFNKPSLLFSFILILYCCCCFAQSDTTAAFFKNRVMNWEKTFNSKDVGDYLVLFKKHVVYNGKISDKYAYTEEKYLPVQKYSDLSVRIAGDISVEKLNDFQAKCSFKQILTFNDNSKELSSYLVFEQQGDDWKISELCDSVVLNNVINTPVKKDSVNNYDANPPLKKDTVSSNTVQTSKNTPTTNEAHQTEENTKSVDSVNVKEWVLGLLLVGAVVFQLFRGKKSNGKWSSPVRSNFQPKQESIQNHDTFPPKNYNFERQTEKHSKTIYNYLCSKCNNSPSCLPIKKDSPPNPYSCHSGGLHNWINLGEVGNDNYQCRNCGITVASKKGPNPRGCHNNAGNMHMWMRL